MTNTGTKKWKHVRLVHLDGVQPFIKKLLVPEVKPGDSVELMAQYPALGASAPDNIKRWVESDIRMRDSSKKEILTA